MSAKTVIGYVLKSPPEEGRASQYFSGFTPTGRPTVSPYQSHAIRWPSSDRAAAVGIVIGCVVVALTQKEPRHAE